MNHEMSYPAFMAYALACLALCANLIFLWAWSGVTRGKTGVAINQEDAARFKTQFGDTDPPAVARVLRAHRNAEANIYPFLILGLLFVLAGGGAGAAEVLFGIFVAARWLHSCAYLQATQPLRTIAFIGGGLSTLVLFGWVIALLLK